MMYVAFVGEKRVPASAHAMEKHTHDIEARHHYRSYRQNEEVCLAGRIRFRNVKHLYKY